MLTWAKLFQTVQYDLMKLFIQFIHKKKEGFVSELDITKCNWRKSGAVICSL